MITATLGNSRAFDIIQTMRLLLSATASLLASAKIASATTASAMAEHDLTQKLIPHLDRHLAIPLLGHLADVASFPQEQIARAQYDLVAGTNMFDYIQSLAEQVNVNDNKDFAKLRQEATDKYNTLQKQAEPVMKVIEDPEAVAKLRSGSDRDKNLDMLRAEYNVSLDPFLCMKMEGGAGNCGLGGRRHVEF